MSRIFKLERETKETKISVMINFDRTGDNKISTGIGFFDHMLNSFALHGGFELHLSVEGDIEVDGHHTVEDTGIALGAAFKGALSDCKGINRYGAAFIPMDEALGFASVDISNRPYLVFNAEFPEEKIGGFDSCLTEEFFRAFAFNAGLTLHLKAEYGKNSHHIAEALFKAAAHALKAAVAVNGNNILSTKGVL
ncbi:MAG: imidazoleglycerol-phosphate dehydratase HisB [Oscillospiraceae bacterium]|nr:imidazoleglycerol-phosphate dehydratase HisB [Oscillospiraceae bacterium]